ncbi:hypothetical protein N7G274_006650 [Stereocaulon virgatum]|uniref:Uncharacterized protein n=1 Tax=Stereocaulon virgatum TaxID=373712 RepID=A0ABR4A705_9LECA
MYKPARAIRRTTESRIEASSQQNFEAVRYRMANRPRDKAMAMVTRVQSRACAIPHETVNSWLEWRYTDFKLYTESDCHMTRQALLGQKICQTVNYRFYWQRNKTDKIR